MTTSTIMMATLILILGAAQYALCVQAMRDLVRRPRVRGENKVLWALLILCLPIAGAIVYNWMGPTSFMHRPVLSSGPRNDAPLPEIDPYPTYGPHSNVTPINAARSAQRRRTHGIGTVQRNRPVRRSSFTDRTGS